MVKQRTKTKIANGLAYTTATLFLLFCLAGLIWIAIMSWKSALVIAALVGLMWLGQWVRENMELD